MRLRKTRLAEADLAAIADYGVDMFGADRALAYIDAIEALCRSLLEFPNRGRGEDALHSGLRSLPCGSHRIFYSIQEDSLVIRRVLHKAMDAERWLG